MKRSKPLKLYKRSGSTFWQLAYEDLEGRRARISTRAETKSAATKAAREFLKDLRRAQLTEPPPKRITLGEALEDYHRSLEARGKPSAANVATFIRKILGRVEPRKPHPRSSPEKAEVYRKRAAKRHRKRWHLDHKMPLADLKPLHLEDLIRARFLEGFAAQTIGHELKTLRAAVKLADELGYVVPRIVKWRIPTGAAKTRHLSPEEFEAVLLELTADQAIGKRLIKARREAADLLIALAFLGGRWSEVANLQWTGVNMEERTVTLWGSKTQKMRVVPLPDPVREVFARRLAARTATEALPEVRTSPYVFPQSNGQPRVTGCRPITDAMDRAGLNTPARIRESGKATIHSLRHTYASWLRAGGADLSDVQQALGHTTLQMTRRYSHLGRTQALSRLTKALAEGGPKAPEEE